MTTPRILIAGIGNIFLGDDAFGVEVVRRLAERAFDENVRVVDFGIRGFDLAMALLEEADLVVLVDAASRGGPPGTLYVIEPEPDGPEESLPNESLLDMHTMDPVKVLRLAKSFGSQLSRVLIVACEPANFGCDEYSDITSGLSEPVHRAVDQAVTLIESIIRDAVESNLTRRAM
jgi:hydrogenase maturation protease